MSPESDADPLRSFGPAPSAGEIEEMGRRILAALPPEFMVRCANVALRVEEFADEETLADMDIDDPFELAGLYRGVPLTERGADDPTGLDIVFLYRRPILDWWAEEDATLEQLIRHLVIHEIGHHFGYSDAEMEAVENMEG
ncbi:metallopeptidase family protein [Dongia sp.]|uniref:metallopeptidase family protein n=1 Tax=Dongia sp. TaxID=1977262 RepID=UPI0035B05F3E